MIKLTKDDCIQALYGGLLLGGGGSNCRTLHAHGGHSEKPEDQNGIDRNVAEQGTQIYHRSHNDPFHTSHETHHAYPRLCEG